MLQNRNAKEYEKESYNQMTSDYLVIINSNTFNKS